MQAALKTVLTTVILGTMIAAQVWAQAPNAPQPANQDPADTADHGVARLSVMEGNVSMRHGDLGDLTAAALNAPLTATDRVSTGDTGRAEIQFDAANMIRLAPSTEVRLSQLEYKRYQVEIAQGTTTFRVERDNDAQVEISTPTVSLHPVRRGTYRVTVQPDGETEITVRQGQAQIFGPTGSEDLNQGQTMMARGTADNPEVRETAAIPSDDWDRWNSDRDRDLQRAEASARYTSPDVYGTESLDQNGRWTYDPQYGQVWVPNEPPGWAPYQLGRWVWLDYYGWTWVSDDPWGWAPYHYGNWYYGGLGWAWYPGPIYARYYWRPALVGFFGWGPGVGVGVGFGFGFGNVGWVPLAPFEVYRPWYGAGFAGRVNIVNVNVTNVYRNARVVNGVTSMRASQFGRTPVNSGSMVRASAGDLARAGSVRGSMPFTPSAASRRMSDRAVNSRGAPQVASNRQFSRGASPRSAPNAGGWRRIQPSGGSRGNGQSRSYGESRGNNAAPRGYGESRGGGSFGNRAPQERSSPGSSARPLRINPPIVRQRGGSGGGRSQPRFGGGGFGGNRGGGGGHGGRR